MTLTMEMYIHKCIESILTQTFNDFELILIDDGSSDNCGRICDEYAEKDNRVKVIHKENGGLSDARNSGIEISKGQYIGFIDSDDYIDVNMFQNLYDLCVRTKSDIAICKFGREINGELINKEAQEDIFIKEMDNVEAMRELFKGVLYRFSVCNKFFKKECFKDIRFPKGRIHEDLSTTYKLFANAKKAVYTNYIGYIYTRRENSILTSKFNKNRLDAFIGWNEILPFMNEKYPILSREYISCFVYGSVDNVHYILNQVVNKEDKEKYLTIIQQCIRKYYKDIIKNDKLSLNHKYVIILLKYNIHLLLLSNAMKKMLLGR